MYSSSQQSWLNPNIHFLFNSTIYEYDIQDAGLNIIREFGLLPENVISELEQLDKHARHIQIGKLQRDDRDFSEALMRKFADIRQRFVYENQLTDGEIISVKKDAFFITKHCSRIDFGQIRFVVKNKYTSYIRFVNNHNIECYYGDDNIDIKGMSDISINKHRLFMLTFLMNYFSMMEIRNPSLKRTMMDFISKYKAQTLEDGYYLEFNQRSNEINPIHNYTEILIPLIQIINGENI